MDFILAEQVKEYSMQSEVVMNRYSWS